MIKKGRITLFKIAITILIILIILGVLIFSSIMFAKAQQSTLNEETKIKRAYSWLETQTIGRWNLLTIDQITFSYLALKEKISEEDKNSVKNSLLSKSYNNQCWPKANCNSKDTALAKITLDQMNYNTENISKYLIEKNISAQGIDWYLQITSTGNKLSCNLVYQNSVNSIIIDEKNKISGNAGNCFSKEGDYWLKLNPGCSNKIFNISCNDSAIVNFLFKKDNAWYVTNEINYLSLGESREINVESICISNNNVCDYESTLWTAYSFVRGGQSEKAYLFLPYLITFKKDNIKYFPDSFLYSITKKTEYLTNIEEIKGISQLILLNPSQYNEYYDSALSMILTEGGNQATLRSMKTELLNKQSARGSWDPTSVNGNNIRETAMILLGFWQDFDPRNPCEIAGLSCVSNCSALGTLSGSGCPSNLECCKLTSLKCEDRGGNCSVSCGYNQVATQDLCNVGICCKDYSKAYCISELNGNLCSSNQKCSDSSGNLIDFISSKDSNSCCLGTCVEANQLCSQLGGEICSPDEGKHCASDKLIASSIENFCCQQGYCLSGVGTCRENNGEVCNSDYVCKEGQFIIATDTNNEPTCCIGTCIPNTCDQISGTKCEEGQICTGNNFETADSLRCCTEGICTINCREMGGEICSEEMTCDGETKTSSEGRNKCCIGECKKKSGFPWIILIIIIALGLIIAVFLLFRNKKFKSSGDSKSTQTKQKPKPSSFIFTQPIQTQQRPSLIQRPTLLQKKPTNIPLPPTP